MWGDYSDNLLNYKEPDEVFSFNLETREKLEYLKPMLEEIRFQINTLKNHKSSGDDQILAEILKKEKK